MSGVDDVAEDNIWRLYPERRQEVAHGALHARRARGGLPQPCCSRASCILKAQFEGSFSCSSFRRLDPGASNVCLIGAACTALPRGIRAYHPRRGLHHQGVRCEYPRARPRAARLSYLREQLRQKRVAVVAVRHHRPGAYIRPLSAQPEPLLTQITPEISHTNP